MASILDKRLVIFSGKGGVGKSTVAAAAAIAAARKGKQVLILEVGDQERIPAVFGAGAAAGARKGKAGYQGARVWPAGSGGPSARGKKESAPSIWSMCLTGREALHEFVIRQVKFERIYEAVFENRVIKYFTAAAPGLDELVIMGKIEDLVSEEEPSRKATHPRFDLVIFDAPATGHGLAFFKVPRMTMEMVKLGPLHTRAFRMWNLLSDPERTSFNIVTLPEEMPVNESVDLDAAAREIGLPPGKLLVNGVYPPLFAENGLSGELDRLSTAARPGEDIAGEISRFALEAARVERGRYRLHREMVERLAEALPKRERLELPFLFEPELGIPELERLADSLATL